VKGSYRKGEPTEDFVKVVCGLTTRKPYGVASGLDGGQRGATDAAVSCARSFPPTLHSNGAQTRRRASGLRIDAAPLGDDDEQLFSGLAVVEPMA